MSKKRNEFNDSAYRNKLTYIHYRNHLTELAISMFEWKNLPPTIDPRYLELTLFEKGRSVFFYDEDIGYLALPVAAGDVMEFNNEPKFRHAYASNGYNAELTSEDSVMIYNNVLRENSLLDVMKYSMQLYDLDRSIEVNARAQKTPVVILCDENERLTFMNLYKDVDGNCPIVYGTKDLDLKRWQAISTQAPFVADKLYTLKTEVWNEALTHLGISNVNIQKRERLISDEVRRNNGGTIASRYSRLEMRREAAKKINAMFGLNLDVDYREDYMYEENGEIVNTTNNETQVIMEEVGGK